MPMEIDDSALARKLRDWSTRPEIMAHNWAPRLFWRAAPDTPYGYPRVAPSELEVYFATLLGEPSEYRAQLDRTHAGRGAFLAANARRHELPLFSPHPASGDAG
ncbi:hypothetical protein BI364_07650 [Acidihalobacter yilgarnensis]|uniref:Uncharacterized protein n=2 Tax=Acidihalobacter yilgarnensis TaxID=2819280 RepID=A0A1D8IN64_9GAMM|nr:hypothetical protein BI364_07650 [Acidihalobacter yilgarnensis]